MLQKTNRDELRDEAKSLGPRAKSKKPNAMFSFRSLPFALCSMLTCLPSAQAGVLKSIESDC